MLTQSEKKVLDIISGKHGSIFRGEKFFLSSGYGDVTHNKINKIREEHALLDSSKNILAIVLDVSFFGASSSFVFLIIKSLFLVTVMALIHFTGIN